MALNLGVVAATAIGMQRAATRAQKRRFMSSVRDYVQPALYFRLSVVVISITPASCPGPRSMTARF